MDLFITRPKKEDVEEIRHLFTQTITDAFRQDGIDDASGLREEIEKQMQFLKQDFESEGKEAYFLLAKIDGKIAGTIAYKEANEKIKKNIQTDLSNVPEIASVYVLPKLQGKGIGALLFNAILVTLLHKKVDGICLDGGYKKSQKYWTKKLGDPSVTLKDYWGKGFDHLIWLRKLSDISILYKRG